MALALAIEPGHRIARPGSEFGEWPAASARPGGFGYQRFRRWGYGYLPFQEAETGPAPVGGDWPRLERIAPPLCPAQVVCPVKRWSPEPNAGGRWWAGTEAPPRP